MSGIVRVSTPTPLELAVKRVERAIRAAERGDAPPECIGLTATVDVFTLNLLLEAVDEAEHKAKDSEDLRYEIESLSDDLEHLRWRIREAS